MPRTRPGMAEPEARVPGGSYSWRLILATTLWGLALFLVVAGSGMDWNAPVPASGFPHPVWGDSVDDAWGIPTMITGLLGVLMASLWWMSGPAAVGGVRSWAAPAARVVRWVCIGGSLGGLGIVSWVLIASMRESWMLWPGWLGLTVTQVCVLIAAILVPPADAPQRRRVVDVPKATYPAAALVVAVAVGVILYVPVLPNSSQRVQISGTEDVEPWVARDELSGATTAPGTPPPAPSGLGGGAVESATAYVQSLSASTPQVAGVRALSPTTPWLTAWRGASAPVLISTHFGPSTAVLLTQAIPERPALVLLDGATGEVRESLDTAQLRSLGIDTTPDGLRDHPVALYGDVLIASGQATEWVTSSGARVDGQASWRQMRSGTFARSPQGMHGRNLISGATWFVGDDGQCERRLLRAEDASWVAAPSIDEGGAPTLVLIQVCHLSADPEAPAWGAARGAEHSLEPLSATIMGVSSADGHMVWSQTVPGWQTWALTVGENLPSLASGRIPLEVRLDQASGNIVAEIAGVRTELAPATGQTIQGL